MEENYSNSETIHDFLHERLILKIFGGFYILQKPTLYFMINALLIACVFIMVLFLFFTGIYTFAVAANTAALKIQILFTLIIMPLAFLVPAIRYCYRGNFNRALKILKEGIDKYSCELPDEVHENIKRKRVKQVRLWSLIFGVLCYLSAISNSMQSPIIQFLSPGKNNSSSEAINPYLPLPLSMPFDTRTYQGYVIAFLSLTIYLFFTYTALFCFTESYLSSALQLLAQIEILNYSLTNIEKRATSKLKQGRQFFASQQYYSDKEDKVEFQKNLYICLRTNIQHHQTIIRCKFSIKKSFNDAVSVILLLCTHLLLTTIWGTTRFAQEVKEYLGAMNTLNLVNFGLIFATSVVPVVQDPMNNLVLSLTVLSLEMTGYLQLFWVGQIISDTSADTMNLLYSTPWTHGNRRYNILLNLMMTSAKKRIVLRSPSFNSDWTLETFGVVLSGAYKLVNLLLNTM